MTKKIKPIRTDCICGHAEHLHDNYADGQPSGQVCWGIPRGMSSLHMDQYIQCTCNNYVRDNLKYIESVYDASND